MDSRNIKESLKKGMLLSAGLFLLGKKKVKEVADNLEENGMTKQEAEHVANEVLESAREHKNNFIKKIAAEISSRNIFATKDDVEKIQKTLDEISEKIDE